MLIAFPKSLALSSSRHDPYLVFCHGLPSLLVTTDLLLVHFERVAVLHVELYLGTCQR